MSDSNNKGDMAMKRICILRGSPRRDGNTNQLVRCFSAEAEALGCEIEQYNLYDMELLPCLACRACQKDWAAFGCAQQDDMHLLFDAIMRCDLLVLATPIYSWYCTPPMKAVLDRMVYGMNKYYGERKGPALWAGKNVAVITTCGYRPEQGADLWAEGLRRYCKHSQLVYRGMLAERHLGYGAVFMDANKETRARAFARDVLRTDEENRSS